MIPVYIAAPYGQTAWHTVGENIRRADALARHAVEQGYAPIVIHRAIAAGVYGDDFNAAERDRGIMAARSIAASVATAGGELWLLHTPSGGVTFGCRMEVRAYLDARGNEVREFRMGDNFDVEELGA